ncbi:type II toxin-antitoxin system ParD family antitoxin [uncultured Gimesia sp.]|uniref:type II toxin-antitoxin system ParD family antitoxin n=1 Tax=uncultured Gimesia sp. TaxID=1678688 RepID=UPI00262A3463|nr:type II toxin-antitoxin system ParD family antitoxin [uncultured Gimesia sp.]
MSTNISLTPEIEAYAQSMVASGYYKSVSEFVREAIRLHRKHEQLYLRELHKELSLASDQIDHGQTEPHNMQAIIDEVHAERQARKK